MTRCSVSTKPSMGKRSRYLMIASQYSSIVAVASSEICVCTCMSRIIATSSTLTRGPDGIFLSASSESVSVISPPSTQPGRHRCRSVWAQKSRRDPPAAFRLARMGALGHVSNECSDAPQIPSLAKGRLEEFLQLLDGPAPRHKCGAHRFRMRDDL